MTDFDEWWQKVVKIYEDEEVASYGGFVYTTRPPKGLERELSKRSKKAVEQFANDEQLKKAYRQHFNDGCSPEKAFSLMF